MTGIDFFQTDIAPKDGRIHIFQSSSSVIKYPQSQTTNSEISYPFEEMPERCEDFGSGKENLFHENSDLPSHNNISPFFGSTSNVLDCETINFEDPHTFSNSPPELFEKIITESQTFSKPLSAHPMNNPPAKNKRPESQFQFLQDQSPKEVNFEKNDSQSLKNSEEFCSKLIPRINKVTPHNYGELLVDVLRGISRDIPLEEFYELLHNSLSLFSDKNKQVSPFKTKARQEGLKICSFIIEIFGSSYMSNGCESFKSVNNSSFRAVKFYEFIRTFLAIKILFDSIEEVDSCQIREKSIPRKSIYKAYCLICKNLSQSYTAVPTLSKIRKNIVVGSSQLGRIMKLVYPNLQIRRLGRRGSSRYHCLGMTWNRSIIDDKILKMLEVENSDPLKYQSRGNEKKYEKNDINENSEKNIERYGNEYGNNVIKSCFRIKKSLYSFIKISTTLPEIGCPPRSWEYFPGQIPQPSSWSQNVISRSMDTLRKYNINMESFIENLEKYVFAAVDLNLLFDNFVERVKTLKASNSEDAAYSSLYLSVLLPLFPIVLASDEEVPCEAKVQLRKNLASFNHQLRITGFLKQKPHHLTNFSHIIRKMIHISDMTSSRIPTHLVESVINEIVTDLSRSTDTPFSVCEMANEEIIFNAVISASKAYGPAFFGNNPALTAEDKNEMIMGIARAFRDFSNATTCRLKEVPGSLSSKDLEGKTYDLPFQIFKSSVRFFHEICLSDPFVSKLPIQVINMIAFKMNKEMQNLSFSNFFIRDRDISKETFKTWWVHSALAEEYMQIFAEIVAMTDYLS